MTESTIDQLWKEWDALGSQVEAAPTIGEREHLLRQQNETILRIIALEDAHLAKGT